jgi:hypothetical protein
VGHFGSRSVRSGVDRHSVGNLRISGSPTINVVPTRRCGSRASLVVDRSHSSRDLKTVFAKGELSMRVLFGLAIVLGAIMGVPIDPEKIREMLAISNQVEIAQEGSEDDEDIEEYLKKRGLHVK